MQIPEYRWPSFHIALYQFVMPVIDILSDGTKIRLHGPSFLHKPDPTILTNLDSLLPEQIKQVLYSPPARNLRCKNVGCVQRPNQETRALPQLQIGQHRHYVAPLRQSSTLTKRTKTKEKDHSGKKRRKTSEKTEDFKKLKKYGKSQISFNFV